MQAGESAWASVLLVEDEPAMQVRACRLLAEVAGQAVRVDVAGDLA